MQRKAKHPGHLCDEPVAGTAGPRDRGLGRGEPPRPQQPPLRGPGRRHNNLGPGQVQVRPIGQPRR